MDIAEIIETRTNVLKDELETLHSRFVAELRRLGHCATSAADRATADELPGLGWLEMHMATLRQMADSYGKAAHSRETIRELVKAARSEERR